MTTQVGAFFLALTSILFALQAGASPSFTGLGQLTGYEGNSAVGISGDGRVVVGVLHGSSEPYRWQDGVFTPLGKLSGATQSFATATSADGAVVVGYDMFPDGRNVAFRWQDGNHVALEDSEGGSTPDRATGVSGDGSVIVGRLGWNAALAEPFRWQAGITTPLGSPDGQNEVVPLAAGVSADGLRVVGPSPGQDRSWLWESGSFTPIDGMNATAISDDGSAVVGNSFRGPLIQEYEASMWTEEGGVVMLGRPNGIGSTRALDVSSFGSVVVGSARATNASGWATGPFLGFVWDASGGSRMITDYVENVLGLDISGWTLNEVTGVSSDGLTMVGYGTNPNGVSESWILVIPEPSTAILLALGLMFLTVYRERSARA